jgi:hypothetical protein
MNLSPLFLDITPPGGKASHLSAANLTGAAENGAFT